MGISLFWNLVFIASASQGIFLFGVLIVQCVKAKDLSKLFLALFILAFSFNLTNNLVYWNQLFEQFPHFLFSTAGLRFLFAPLFFLYCLKHFTKRISHVHLLHFIPFVVLFLSYSPAIFLSGSQKLALISSPEFYQLLPQWKKFIVRNINWALCIQLIGYSLFIFYLIKKKWKTLQANKNDPKVSQVRWLHFLNILFLVYGLTMLFYWILVAKNVGTIWKDYPISLVMCILIYGISYINILNPELLKGKQFLEKVSLLKYSKTRLSEAYLNSIIEQFERIITNEELFLHADLKISNVAEKLNIPKHHISQALSLKLSQSFSDYINALRVKYAQHLLDNISKKDNIKSIMYSSGFNNRASFNNNFKKHFGMTASEYIKTKRVS